MTILQYAAADAGTGGTTYFNLIRDKSFMESKNHEHTNREGHVIGFLVNYEVTAASEQVLNFITAPNSWKMRNSFRKFHAYRNMMFENAGITNQEKGKYGHTIRPYLDNNHRLEEEKTSGQDVGQLFLWDGAADPVAPVTATGGEWTYSELATVPLYEQSGPQMGASSLKVADEWPVMVCGKNVLGATETDTSGSYASVGMIHSYNLDRMEINTPETTVSGPQNPLAALIASGNQAAGEILDIASEQELELPPYDLLDGGDSVFAVSQTTVKTPTTLGVVRGSCFVPAGLLGVFQKSAGDYTLHLTVVGEVLCKDMA